MTRQRPRKAQAVEPTEQTAEPINAAAPATATLVAEDHPQEPDAGGGAETDRTGAEPTAPVAPTEPMEPTALDTAVTLAEELPPEPAPAPLTGGKAQTRPPRGPRQPRPTKLARLQQMLRVPGGASLPALLEATGWQAHTLRAALTRLRQAGHAVERGRTEDGVTSYRIVDGAGQPAGAKAASPHGHPAPGDASAARGLA